MSKKKQETQTVDPTELCHALADKNLAHFSQALIEAQDQDPVDPVEVEYNLAKIDAWLDYRNAHSATDRVGSDISAMLEDAA